MVSSSKCRPLCNKMRFLQLQLLQITRQIILTIAVANNSTNANAVPTTAYRNKRCPATANILLNLIKKPATQQLTAAAKSCNGTLPAPSKETASCSCSFKSFEPNASDSLQFQTCSMQQQLLHSAALQTSSDRLHKPLPFIKHPASSDSTATTQSHATCNFQRYCKLALQN